MENTRFPHCKNFFVTLHRPVRKKFNGYVLISLLLLSACSTEGNLKQILGVSAEAPVFLDCRPVSSTEIVFKFSVPVRVSSLHLDPVLEANTASQDENVSVIFPRALDAGIKITADMVVEDANRNSLNVVVPFRARNDRMPKIVFNELRTENTKPKAEFIEFFTLSPGNLGAMRLFIASNSLTKPVYEFPPVEVKAGEYIVLHLRATEEGCLDETGEDLSLSGGTDAQITARDLWVFGNTKLLRKTDALLLLDQDDKIIDGVLICENPEAGWGNKKEIAEAAEMLGRQGVWSPDPLAVIHSKSTTNTRTICRDESLPPGGAGNWYITVTSGATPGRPNNVKRYQ